MSAGVFTTGHVGAEALDEIARILRPGGIAVLTVKDAIWEGGFRARVEEMGHAGRLALREETQPYVSMPGQPGTEPGRCVVLAV